MGPTAVAGMLLSAIIGPAAMGTDRGRHTTGPARGTLILYGGGGQDFDTTFGKFVELAGEGMPQSPLFRRPRRAFPITITTTTYMSGSPANVSASPR